MLIFHNHAVTLFWAGSPMPPFETFSVLQFQQSRKGPIDRKNDVGTDCHLSLKMGRSTAIFSWQDEETCRQPRQLGSPGSAQHQFLTWGKSVKSSSWDQEWSPGHGEVDTKTSVNCTISPGASSDLWHSWTGLWIDMFINPTKQFTKWGCLMGLQHALCGDYSIPVSSFQSYCWLSGEYCINFNFGKLLIVVIHEVAANSISNYFVKIYTLIGVAKPRADTVGIVTPWARASVQRILAPKRVEML